MRLTDWLERREERGVEGLDGPDKSPETSAIVVGYGRFGQTVAQMLMAKRIPVTIIDSKPSQIELSEEFGTKVYYGDGTRVDLLRTAGAENAEGILFCQNPKELTRDKLEAVFASFPHVAIMWTAAVWLSWSTRGTRSLTAVVDVGGPPPYPLAQCKLTSISRSRSPSWKPASPSSRRRQTPVTSISMPKSAVSKRSPQSFYATRIPS